MVAEAQGEGRTLEEALRDAASKLETTVDELEYEVIRRPSRGLLGVGAKPAVVRATCREDPLGYLTRLVKTTAGLMGFEVAVDVREEQGVLFADVQPEDSPGLLVGKGGECLQALQHLTGRMLGMRQGTKVRVALDVAGYRQRRASSLTRKAKRIAEQVKSTGRHVTLDPLWAADRRVVHIALRDDPAVTTKAHGDGLYKRITIAPAEGNARDPASQEDNLHH